MFVLGLLLQFLFALVLKGTPLALPPSGRLSSGIEVMSLVQVWHLEDVTGPLRGFLDFVSRLYIPRPSSRASGARSATPSST